MTKTFTAGAFVLALAAAAPGFAGDLTQLARRAGVSPDAGLTLDTLAALKFNQESDGDEQQTVMSSRGMPGSVLERFAAAHFSRHVRSDEQHVVIDYRDPIPADATRHAQLIAAAGIDAEAAQGVTIGEVAAAKFGREPDEGSRF